MQCPWEPAGARGLIGWSVRFPGAAPGGEALEIEDPDGVTIRVVGGASAG